MRILIVGAGPAGLSLAFWLCRLTTRSISRHSITILESAPTLRTSGLQIDLRGHGITVLKRMGIESKFREKMAPEQGAEVVDSSGRRRAYFPANNTAGGKATTGKETQGFTTEWEIMRGDFVQLLVDACAGSNVRCMFGTKIEILQQDASQVRVRFSNGDTDTYDLVVGADGVGSQVRRLMLESGPDPRFPIDGLVTAYYTMPSPINGGENFNAVMYLTTKKRGIMIRRSTKDKLQVYIGGKPDPSILANVKRGDAHAEKAALARWFRDAGWRSSELVQGMINSEDFYCERIALVKMPYWSKGRVALLGDAAYCPSVMTGMGNTCAITGAYILAGEIAQADEVEPALRAYEERFRPYMEKVQEGVLEDNWASMPEGKFGVGVFNLLAGLVSFFKIDVARWMMKEDIRDWQLPLYEELELRHGEVGANKG